MRVALVSEHASPLAVLGGVDAGGQNVHVAALARALARRGHVVEVHTRRDARDLPERVPLCPGVDVVHVSAGPARPLPKDDLLPWMPAFAAGLSQAWARRRPDVVHAHFWMSGQAALEAGRAAGLPVLLTFHALGVVKRRHQGDYDTSPAERAGAEAVLAREVDLVVATCRDEVAELTAMGAPVDRLRVVPCGVDVHHFTPTGPSAGRSAASRLVSVGRLVERKGVETAVRALPVLPGAELVVVGGPPAARLHRDPEALRLGALAADLGVADRVRLVGRVDHADLPAVLRSADVVVATPWYEPFGIAPVEAMACGRPVVGSAVGGLLDTVEHGRTGSLVPPRDPAALAAAVQPLLDDAALREAQGAAARRRVLQRFSWERVAAATEAAYAEVAGGGARGRRGRTERTSPDVDEPLEAR